MNLRHSLILASKSPRRQQLLREAGFQFRTVSLEIAETFPATLPVDEVARYLAEKKAKAFRGSLDSAILITADTVVITGGRVLGKPAGKEEAVEMLSRLSGKAHKVITGVCLRHKQEVRSFDEVTKVYFRTLLRQEIDAYIDRCQPFDKAGGYGIQEWIGLIGIERIEGSYFNVVGLPVHRIYEALNAYTQDLS